MAARRDFSPPTAMVSRWRRRRMCVLVNDGAVPAALRDISGAGAFVETNARPSPGTMVRLYHPDAGTIAAEVSAIAADGILLRFDRSREAVTFALVAIASDMTRSN